MNGEYIQIDKQDYIFPFRSSLEHQFLERNSILERSFLKIKTREVSIVKWVYYMLLICFLS